MINSVLSRLLVAAAFGLLSATVIGVSGPSVALAVQPGVNCTPYTGPGGVCEIEIGDIWFCDSSYRDGILCPTSVIAGDTVRWNYPDSGIFMHTTTHCGEDCNSPTTTPLWDSGRLLPGESFEFTFSTPGMYPYYCSFHSVSQRGLIRVLETPLTGDANCDSDVNVVDALVILQLEAGLIDALPCQVNADVNEDGSINAVDALLILKLEVGLIDSLSD